MLIDVPRRFRGVARLYGEHGYGRLRNAHCCVIGIGGVGSWAVEALARSGLGRLTLIDGDHVAESNINRQIQAIQDNIGKPKVLALKERIHQINQDCIIDTHEDMLALDNLQATIPTSCDYLLDCIDKVPIKAATIQYCIAMKMPFISMGGAGGKVDPSLIQYNDIAFSIQDPLLARTRSHLRKQYGLPRQPKKPMGVPVVFSSEATIRPNTDLCNTTQGLNCAGYGSSMVITATFGLFAAAKAINHIVLRTE